MSLEQGAQFAKGLRALSDDFRLDSRTRTEEYTATLEEIVAKFQSESHDYAKDMVARADKYVTDIQELYNDIYDYEEEETEPPTT